MQKMLKRLADVDIYGAPVQLNFRGASSFKTARGGILTFLVIGLTILIIMES